MYQENMARNGFEKHKRRIFSLFVTKYTKQKYSGLVDVSVFFSNHW